MTEHELRSLLGAEPALVPQLRACVQLTDAERNGPYRALTPGSFAGSHVIGNLPEESRPNNLQRLKRAGLITPIPQDRQSRRLTCYTLNDEATVRRVIGA